MVLFLFIIMLLDLAKMEHMPRQKIWMGCALVLALGLIYLFARTLNQIPMGFVTQQSLPPISSYADNTVVQSGLTLPNTPDGRDDTHQIGRLLFTRYVAPFEVTSLLILVATVGVVVLCKQDEPRRPSPREEIVREAPPINPKKETALTR
jgi:NADH:ubiquinone oxidoreductase subunit 6 (subunit J)